MTYNLDEGDSDNHYNCPVVAYYPELLLANNEKLNEQNFLHPFLDLNRRKHLITVLYACLSDYATKKEIAAALEHGFAALEQYRNPQDTIDNSRAVAFARQVESFSNDLSSGKLNYESCEPYESIVIREKNTNNYISSLLFGMNDFGDYGITIRVPLAGTTTIKFSLNKMEETIKDVLDGMNVI